MSHPSSGPGWSIVGSPNVNTARINELRSITCASLADCWAVGRAGGDTYGTLIQHWDGHSWAIVNSISPGPGSDELNGVTCVSSTDCWAVGFDYDNSHGNGIYRPLIERWDGLSWSVVPSADLGTNAIAYLHGITCISSAQCWAVGFYAEAPGPPNWYRTLVERWDGNTWTIVPSPNFNETQNHALFDVTCTSVTDCWAVGGILWAQSLIEHWDGASWTIVSSSSPANGTLNSVACPSKADCWAVGYYTDSGGYHSLIKHWNGTFWSVVPQFTAPQPNLLYGVSCLSNSDCWAVGASLGSPSYRTLIGHWDGASWALKTSPNVIPGNDTLYSVTCPSESMCWAAGLVTGSSWRTLVEEYSLTVPPLLSVSSIASHGNAGTFNIDLPLAGPPGVECRDLGGTYSVVFTFVNDVISCGSVGGSGSSVAGGPNPNQCTEILTNVPNANYVTAALNDILDSQGNSGNVSVQMGLLSGDVNADGVVNASDVALTKSRIGQVVDQTNFRSDLSADGNINATDVCIVKARSGAGLP